MSEKTHILVVDDEPQITRVLRTTLSAEGYETRVANDGEMALEIMRDWQPHVIVTDLAMPNLDGVGLCRRIRAFSQVPIIVLSVRNQERQKIEALDAGADDYMTKPFSSNELMARIRAHLRRTPKQQAEVQFLGVGDFRIDLNTRVVTVRGREVKLTPKEFDLLVYLAKSPGRVLTHRSLLASVWGGTSTQQPEYLHVFINHLRKKLEPEDGSIRYIFTEKWVGYRFEPGEEQESSATPSV
jgi:two-component system KDP operon response regulator KdpE